MTNICILFFNYMIDFKKFEPNSKMDAILKREYIQVYQRGLTDILIKEIDHLGDSYQTYESIFQNGYLEWFHKWLIVKYIYL